MATQAEGSMKFSEAQTIPWNQIGTKAGADYKGDGLSVTTTADGARLNCVFQRLEGNATREGLWLTSTVNVQAQARFRVTAVAVNRASMWNASGLAESIGAETAPALKLARHGDVETDGQIVRYMRPGLVEEYSVSMDGLRQDFVVLDKPPFSSQWSTLNPSELRVELSVCGARVYETPYGAQLVLEKSGRKIAYSRLRVTDATGRELAARMEVTDKFEMRLAVVVNDVDAVYPVRIDPTFSDANWISMGGLRGANNPVNVATADGFGNLYIGGDFMLVGDANASRVAKWNGTKWSSLGGGVSGTVYSLAAAGSDLYVGGIFRTATNSGDISVPVNYIAKWDGTNWSSPGLGLNFYVFALAVTGSDVYAGGNFTRATNTGGISIPASRIAKWDGSTWSAPGPGLNNDVWALATSGSDVYAGGTFTVATNTGGGVVTVNRIAKWNGSNWSALGAGVNQQVSALAAMGSNVYAGGSFTAATNTGGVPVTVNRVAKWNGTSWSALGAGMNNSVTAVTLAGSDLYAVGYFIRATNSGGASITATRAAKWNGSSWSALGTGMESLVNAVAAVGSDVYVGGGFTTAGGVTALRIAKWDRSSWSVPGAGFNNSVAALAVSGSDVYAGGQFTTAGEVKALNIAKWNGSSWSAVGAGMNSSVNALVMAGSDLYAGGNFTVATNTGGGAVTVHRIAKWDGANWSAVGGGMNDYVSELVASGNDVYAGGNFIRATNNGGVPVTVNRVARWDGNNWNALGAGLNSSVQALAVSASNVYAGGSFTLATNSGGGAVPAMNIAWWDGSNWSALGGGLNFSVNGLAVAGSNVYAGGNFTVATNAGGGAVTVNRIAGWNGSSWSALGRGMSDTVNAIAVSGSDVFAGGSFTRASNTLGAGVLVNYITKWDGTNWTALGSGMNNFVFELAATGNDLYAAGAFTTAGGKVSASVARAEVNPTPAGYNQITPQLLSGGQMRLSYVGMAESSYALDRTFSLSPPIVWQPQATNMAALDGSLVFTNIPVPITNNFWRIRLVP